MFNFLGLDIAQFFPLLSMIFMLSLGVIVFNYKRDRLGLLFLFISLVFAVWTFGTFMMFISRTDRQIIFWDRFIYLGVTFMPAFQYHFSLLLTRFTPSRKKLLVSAYVLSGLFLLLSRTDYFVKDVFYYRWGVHTEARILHHFFLAFFFFYIFTLLYNLFLQYRSSKLKIEKVKLILITIGFTILNIVGGIGYLPAYKISIFSPISLVAPLLFSVIIAYAIIKYRFMDIRIAVRKSFVYSGMTFFIFVFLSIFLWAFGVFYNFSGFSSVYLVVIIAAIFFTTTFYYLERLLVKIANKYFFAGLYNYQETIKTLSRELTYYNNLEEIIDLIVNTIKKTIQLSRIGLLLIEQAEKKLSVGTAKVIGFNKKMAVGLIVDEFLFKQLEKTRRPLVADEFLFLANNAKKAARQTGSEKQLYKRLTELKISLCLPLASKGKLIGVVILGEKLSGSAYSKEDLELLSVLADQAGIAINNAQLYKQVKDFNVILQDKVDEQIKELKNKADELEEKNENLNRLLQVKNEFLRVVNHQLNTPISIIKNSIFMMKSGAFPVEKGLNFIDEGVKRMGEIFNDFWKAFSFEGEGVKLAFEETDLEEILDKSVESAGSSRLVEERGLVVKLEKNIPIPKVKSDPKQIAQVISNLLENAISYTNSGSVTVYFERPDEKTIKVFFKDTGCGIDEEDKGKLFEKFVRGQRAIRERPAGSGLGLYIARKIIKANGGDLRLESSEVGKGSTFSFTVPVWK